MYLVVMPLDLVKSIGIPLFGGFILESIAGPMNTTHHPSNVMVHKDTHNS